MSSAPNLSVHFTNTLDISDDDNIESVNPSQSKSISKQVPIKSFEPSQYIHKEIFILIEQT